MPYRSKIAGPTACGDTTKTLIGTITVPGGATRIVGVCGHALGGAGVTTLENVSGKIELESDDIGITPCQFLLDPTVVLTSGIATHSPRVWPCDIPVQEPNAIRCYITMDMAQTVANTGSVMLIFA